MAEKVTQLFTDAQLAHKYRLGQAEKLLDKFKRAHGRDATTMEELVEWVKEEQRAHGRGKVLSHED